MTEKISIRLTGVPETLLIPLHARAMENQREDCMLPDPNAMEIINRIDFDFSRIRLEGHDELGIILRAREFDRFVRDFLKAHAVDVVVHIGCGLDTRFERVDNGRVEWYDLDLPDVIQLRQELIQTKNARQHSISASVFDPGWMEELQADPPRPFLFIAEGVFPYFEISQIRQLITTLLVKFPGAELVFDAHSPFLLWADNLKLAVSRVNARLQFSLKHGRDVEGWADGIRLLEEWFYFRTDEARVRPYRWMSRVPFLARSTGIYHYQLGKLP